MLSIDLSGSDLTFIFHSKIFLSLWLVQGEVHVGMSDYLRYTNCEAHDHICKQVIRCMKICVPRFLILEALSYQLYQYYQCTAN